MGLVLPLNSVRDPEARPTSLPPLAALPAAAGMPGPAAIHQGRAHPPALKRDSKVAPEVTAALRNMVTSSASLMVSAARLAGRLPRRMMASSAVPSTTQAPMQSSRMDSHSLAMRAVK